MLKFKKARLLVLSSSVIAASDVIQASDIIKWAETARMPFSYKGDESIIINGFSSLSNYKQGSITWIKKQGNIPTPVAGCNNILITCAVLQEGINAPFITNCFFTEKSKEFFFGILEHFFTDHKKIAERFGSYIGPDVQLADDVIIGCNCTLDGKITIGAGTVIEHNVTIINNVTIGENCIIHSGTVIGKDGFGYAFGENNIPVKVQHFGDVRIGNRVEIGANCTVDRGTIDSTIIGDDTKIDNLVLIAHNVEIGCGVTIVGCTDIAGSSHVGDKSYIGPQSCVKNQVKVGSNSFLGMGTLLAEDMGDNMFITPRRKPVKMKDYRRFL